MHCEGGKENQPHPIGRYMGGAHDLDGVGGDEEDEPEEEGQGRREARYDEFQTG